MLNGDLAQAERHIAALTGTADAPVTLQTFSDSTKPDPDPLAKVRHGTLRELWSEITQLQAAGAGVFVNVNETDLIGRGNKNITRLRAVWADMDKVADASRSDWPLKPHLTVQSSPGKFHYYWRTEAPDAAAHAAVLARLVQDHGADKGATGEARVLRLAGTIHQKDPARPHLVSVLETLDRAPYTWDEITAAFPPVESPAAGDGPNLDTFVFVKTLQSGAEGMHEAMLRLTARLAARGIDEPSNLAMVRGLIASGEGASRWTGRDGELTRAVASAYQKFHGFTDVETGKTLDPVNLFPTTTAALEFVPGDYPPIVAKLAADTARRMGCDPLIPAFTAITLCAALIPDRLKIRVKAFDRTWNESARLWVAFVGDPSSKKSPAIASVLVPVYALQARLAAEHREREEVWKQQVAKAREAKQPVPDAPRSQRVLAGDSTTEALVNILETNEDGVLVVHDELAGFFGSMDVYRPAGASKDKPFYLQSFNGGGYTVDRVGKGERFVPNLSLCLLGGIQPDPMRRIAAKLDDDGLLQRFWCVPVAHAKPGEDVAADEHTAAGFSALVNELFNSRNDHFNSWPGAFRFSPEAQQEVDRARRRIHAMGISPGTDKRLASALGKGDGQLARLILTFHLITDRTVEDLFDGSCVPCAEISLTTAQMGIRLFFNLIVPAMHAFYSTVIGLSPTHEHARWLAGLILAREMQEISERDIYRAYHDLRDEGRRNIAPAMAQLELASWVSPKAEKRGVVTEWRVNPAVHSKFAELAIVERDRRERERAEISKNARVAQ